MAAKISFALVVVAALVLGIMLPAVQAQAPAPAPTSDGKNTFPPLNETGSMAGLLIF